MEYVHHYHLSIPTAIDDVDNIPEGVLWEDIKFEEYEIDGNDYNNLFDLFYDINKALDILIDEYEEEIIPASGIDAAIDLAEKFSANATPEVSTSAEKLLIVLKRAKELGKQVLLSF